MCITIIIIISSSSSCVMLIIIISIIIVIIVYVAQVCGQGGGLVCQGLPLRVVPATHAIFHLLYYSSIQKWLEMGHRYALSHFQPLL